MNEHPVAVLTEAIEQYRAVRPVYAELAETVENVLRGVVRPDHPNALVISRVKSVRGFAEKTARRAYVDPMRQMTDLCGVRVVLQTTAEVAAVRELVEAGFVVHEREDKLLRLDLEEFGYRDLHLVVSVPVEPTGRLWAGRPIPREVVGLRFELQVRTWMQHAWAELVHDRLYKAQLDPSPQERRRVAALAALLEEGDRIADDIARSIDRRTASYTQLAPRAQVLEEIEVRMRLMESGDETTGVPEVLALARMQRAVGELDTAIRTLEPHAAASSAVASELGHCLCLRAWDLPDSEEFRAGRELLRAALSDSGFARRDQALRARTLARLAWAVSRTDDGLAEADRLLQEALELDRDNPYLLCDALTMRQAAGRMAGLGDFTAREVARAIEACNDHAAAGLEQPRANLTAARLCLLLGNRLGALSHYARGLTHLADQQECHGVRTLDWERNWVRVMSTWPGLDADLQWVERLLADGPASEAFTPVVVAGTVPEEFGDIDGLRELPVVQRSGPQPSAAEIARAVGAFREVAGAGPRISFLDIGGGQGVYARIALGLGAEVAVSGPAEGDSILADPVWQGSIATLIPVPDDRATFRAVLSVPRPGTVAVGSTQGAPDLLTQDDLIEMAKAIHAKHLDEKLQKLDPPDCPWDRLTEDYVAANLAQAGSMRRILRAAGYDVVPLAGADGAISGFSPDEIELMSELEHGRWNAERLRQGWRIGTRDEKLKLHDNLVSWATLPDDICQYDRQAVIDFPKVLEVAGLAIVRGQ